MSNNKTLEKRGRKHGSQDSVLISIETLLKYVKAETVIPVRRKWAEQLEQFHNVQFINENPSPTVEKSSVVLKEESLGDEKDAVIRPRLELAEENL